MMKYSLKNNIISLIIGLIIGSIICVIKINTMEQTYDINDIMYSKNTEPVYYDNQYNKLYKPSIIPSSQCEYKKPSHIISGIKISEYEQNVIYELCNKYKIRYEIMMAIAMTESNFNPNAISKDGHDFGLCQIRDIFWEQVAIDKELYNWKTDVIQNMKLALHIMNQNLKQVGGHLEEALMLYNTGELNGFPISEDGTTYYTRFIDNYNWILDNQ